MIKLNNLGRVKKDYFTEETRKLIEGFESEVFDKTYYVFESTLRRIKNPEDKAKYQNLLNNNYIWLQFKNH